MNSKQKGSRGERELVGILRSHGYDSNRNEQRYIGGMENPDVTLPGCHIEVKRCEALRLYDSINQAVRDSNGETLPIVMHRKNNCEWLAIMRLDDWFALFREWESSEYLKKREVSTNGKKDSK